MSRHARAPIPPETTALVIVHLSSIMTYVDYYGVLAGECFALDLIEAITTHDGPVVVMDQDWSGLMQCGASLRLYNAIKNAANQRGVVWFHHDEMEDRDPWTTGMDQLAKTLRKLKARKVLVGGLWLSETSGCVRETRQQLTWRRFSSTIVEKWCALEENDRCSASGASHA